MTMHLEGPWLSMSGKKRGKVKFRNAEEARRARELDESWRTSGQKSIIGKLPIAQHEKCVILSC